ncbi:MAG: hypothetical protein P9M15_03055 [Candidatus Electryoneaceae bacterium]|nr:hypothetical protein [Candidatus Electryoneaceae bacterium]
MKKKPEETMNNAQRSVRELRRDITSMRNEYENGDRKATKLFLTKSHESIFFGLTKEEETSDFITVLKSHGFRKAVIQVYKGEYLELEVVWDSEELKVE